MLKKKPLKESSNVDESVTTFNMLVDSSELLNEEDQLLYKTIYDLYKSHIEKKSAVNVIFKKVESLEEELLQLQDTLVEKEDSVDQLKNKIHEIEVRIESQNKKYNTLENKLSKDIQDYSQSEKKLKDSNKINNLSSLNFNSQINLEGFITKTLSQYIYQFQAKSIIVNFFEVEGEEFLLPIKNSLYSSILSQSLKRGIEKSLLSNNTRSFGIYICSTSNKTKVTLCFIDDIDLKLKTIKKLSKTVREIDLNDFPPEHIVENASEFSVCRNENGVIYNLLTISLPNSSLYQDININHKDKINKPRQFQQKQSAIR